MNSSSNATRRGGPGAIGVLGGVKGRAKELVQNIKDELGLRGGKVLREKEF